MAVRDIFRISWRTFFNPAGWIDYEGLKNQNITIYNTLRALFTRATPGRQETYEEAMKRLGVSDEEAQKTASAYRMYALCFFIVGLCIFVYAFYLLFGEFVITGWLLGLAASALCFAQAFKFDYWAFQIRQRKLGVTVSEWSRSILGDKGAST
ncbi:hypothetical protein AQUSIP_03740 [Aquicella siphonis]|uniref:Intracellular multiplication protein IcmV n=1 Tax=Aquicella siphonis TaxID=254247 RepID=A0A5E4PF31_9COXI|nr:hypothetical protein [Aquicella siphonis]VVC75098.1 hypothetical protein AQUSIP_03740 [Aquicella siphonis]